MRPVRQNVRVAIEAVADLRPRLRGTLHRLAAPVAAVGFVLLAFRAESPGHVVAVAIYGGCVTAMLAVSGTYHHRRIPPRARRVLKRVDHATILLAIAGSYTAVTTIALTGTARVVMLVSVWVLAGLGIAIRMLWLDAPRPLTTLVYVLVGWSIAANLPGYLRALSVGEFALLAAGGLAYSVGGVVYARRLPNPWPATFGYHEVFHTLVVIGAACHYVSVAMMLPG